MFVCGVAFVIIRWKVDPDPPVFFKYLGVHLIDVPNGDRFTAPSIIPGLARNCKDDKNKYKPGNTCNTPIHLLRN